MMLDIPRAWTALAERFASTPWRRIAVLGGSDAGKSSFCRFLASFLAQRDCNVWLLDTDLGQKLVGPPACITLGLISAPGDLQLSRIRFVGEASPAANIAGVVAASSRLAAQAAGERLIINTSGLISGPGVTLKRWKLDALDPDHVVALNREGELAPLLAQIPPERVHQLPLSPAARRKSPAARESNRRSALVAALAGSRPVSLGDVVVDDLHRSAPEPDRLRLCGFAGPDGEDLGIGLVRWADFIDRSEVWTNLDPGTVWRMRLGMTSPDLSDFSRSSEART